MNRVFLVAIGLLGAPMLVGVPSANAQGGSSALLACAAVTDDARRLACFDAAVARLRQEQASTTPSTAPLQTAPAVRPQMSPTAGAAVPAAVAAAAPEAPTRTREQEFGLRGDQKEASKQELREIDATVTQVGVRARGDLLVTLDNGQVWAELVPNSGLRVKPGDRIKVKAGALGSFFLSNPSGRSGKVTRVR